MNRWPALSAVVLSVAALSGCGTGADGGQPPSPGLTPGPAVTSQAMFGVGLQPCTTLQLDGYPTNITKPSEGYYQGPWCGLVDTAQLYVWAYARDMSAGVSEATVRVNVARDAEQLYRDLISQGYRQVCGQVVEGQAVDVGLERPGQANMIRLSAAGELGSATTPLALIVTSSPAMQYPEVIEGGPVVPCTAGLPYPVTPTASAQPTTPAQ